MIHVDALDFSECHSEEVMFLLTLSVVLQEEGQRTTTPHCNQRDYTHYDRDTKSMRLLSAHTACTLHAVTDSSKGTTGAHPPPPPNF